VLRDRYASPHLAYFGIELIKLIFSYESTECKIKERNDQYFSRSKARRKRISERMENSMEGGKKIGLSS
jgi:hypothetical protein